MKNYQNRIFLLVFIAVLCFFTGCTSSVPQTEEITLKLKIQEFVDYLIKLDYSNAQACLIVDGPTYSQLDTLYNKVRLITVSGGFSNCFAKGEIYVKNITISGNDAQFSHQPAKIYFNCISSSNRVTFEDLNLTAAQKIGDDWFLW
ncbi:hypothetical protein [Atribacter laminatus]|jgi:hypothetical protein|uniref:Lipoprotein n=1 Tax=Atribacter laminatus TaxID=2847778 RepID=A0A7T1AJ59_ATRLM|nr:hypothetical protein [Atribacter laminatus]QPM66883.1 hypothetical protein RT761_00069 [Atribacter laminatus]